MSSPTNEYNYIRQQFENGEIEKATKEELERFAILLSRVEAERKYQFVSFPQVCETVRTLLIVRMSEEANRKQHVRVPLPSGSPELPC